MSTTPIVLRDGHAHGRHRDIPGQPETYVVTECIGKRMWVGRVYDRTNERSDGGRLVYQFNESKSPDYDL